MRRSRIKRKPKRRTVLEADAQKEFRRSVLASRPALRCSSAHDDGWPIDPHHAIPEQRLRRHARTLGVPEYVLAYDPRIGLPVTRRRHERHHSGIEPICRDELPREVFAFAHKWALTHVLDRIYPKR